MADTNGAHAPTEEEQLLEGHQEEGEEESTATTGGGEELEGSEPAAPAKRQREEDMEQQNLEEDGGGDGKRNEEDAAGTTEESHPQATEGGRRPKKQATDAGREGDADSNIAFAKTHQHTETLEVAKDVVGRIIGKGGETIRDIQTRSGCQVRTAVPPSFPLYLPLSLPPSSLFLAMKDKLAV